MATIPTQTHPLLSIPLSDTADFTTLADGCKRCAEALTKSDDPALRLALREQLAAYLTRLRATQNASRPPHPESPFITDARPIVSSPFEPDAKRLCAYCLALTQTLTNRAALSADVEQALSALLLELMNYLAAKLRARMVGGIIPVS